MSNCVSPGTTNGGPRVTCCVHAMARSSDLDELKTLYAQLLRSGLDIAMMNRIRKRFTRWGAGRLARGLAHAKAVRCYIVSDVIGHRTAAKRPGHPGWFAPASGTNLRPRCGGTWKRASAEWFPRRRSPAILRSATSPTG